MPSPSRYYSSTAAKTTLADSISSSATSLTLSAASNLPAQYPYTLILEKDTANEEVVEVTGLVGSSYQITRNIDNSGAKAHAVGANVEHGVSARDFADSRLHEVATTGVHGITGDVVGTGGAQTITGTKTFSSAIITSAGNLNMATYRITNIPTTPTSSTDAVNQAYVTSISGSASDAAASAASAAISASSAATSSSSAALSASAAATSAANASTSSSSAATSASSAATSAASAATSRSSAATSASSAAASASAAATSETNAAAYELSANNWATKTTGPVAGGEYSAKYHAQLSAASASSAATSVSSAATSASSAATSASSAANSATTVAGQVASGLVRDMGLITQTDTSTGTWIYLSSLETNVNASAASAALSASSAATSASSASTSASNALTSASSAATSAASAAASASAASSSATAAASSAAAAAAVIPSQSGNNGKYLKTDGSTASWATVDALPSQTGNGGKYLTTDGTSATWATITTDPLPSVLLLMGA